MTNESHIVPTFICNPVKLIKKIKKLNCNRKHHWPLAKLLNEPQAICETDHIIGDKIYTVLVTKSLEGVVFDSVARVNAVISAHDKEVCQLKPQRDNVQFVGRVQQLAIVQHFCPAFQQSVSIHRTEYVQLALHMSWSI